MASYSLHNALDPSYLHPTDAEPRQGKRKSRSSDEQLLRMPHFPDPGSLQGPTMHDLAYHYAPTQFESMQFGSSTTFPPTEQTLYAHPGAASSSGQLSQASFAPPGMQIVMENLQPPVTQDRKRRLPGACTNCHHAKLRCVFSEGSDICQRCKTQNRECTVEGRKPRGPNKRPQLVSQLKEKDAQLAERNSIIQQLLQQLQSSRLNGSSPSTPLPGTRRQTPNPEVVGWVNQLEQITPKQAALSENWRQAQHEDDEDMSSSPSEDSESDSAQEDDDPNPLPDSSVPLGLFANLALGNKKGKDEPSDDSADATGIASASYFRPGPAYDLSARKELIESTTLPAIVAQGFVTPADVVSLFEVYYEWLNPWIPILDPVLYTPVATFKRSPLLFTVVCAIASRYHPSKQHIYPLAMDLAKNEAAAVLVNGLKSVEVAQAFLILAVWPTPYRRWEENRSWIYARLATTMAVEFGLHQIKFRGPKNEIRDRETIMGIRVFILLVETEWGMAARWGKPFSTKRPNDYVDLTTFYKISEYNSPSDVGICAYDCLLQVLMEWSEESRDIAGSNTGVQQSCLEIIEQKVRRFDAKLTDLHDEWITRMEEQIKSCPEVYLASAKFRRDLWPYAVTYSRLLVCSFWFRAALKRGLTADNAELFNKCLESATNVVTMSTQTLIPSKFMKYAPDAWFDQAAFASAFLLKLAALQPKLPGLFSDSQKASSIQLVRKFIAGYRASAVDEQHAPSLYARFLDNIITRRFSSSEPQDYLNSKDGHSSRSPSAAPSTASSEGSQAFYTSVFSVVPPSGNRTSAPQPEPTPMYGGSLFDLDNWNFDPIPSFNGGDRAYGFNPNIPGNQTPF